MAVFTHPARTGVKANKEIIITSGSSSTPTTSTILNLVTRTVPAHSIGVDGYLVFDISVSRTGSGGIVILLVTLGGFTFANIILGVGATSNQTRFIIYADHSTTAVKIAANQSTIQTPYYKGIFADQYLMPINTEDDNDLIIGLVIISPGDSATLDGYCLRSFNPSTPNAIVSGRA